ncbi:hypothetical protein CCZ01_06440 [Helicobacter monodelphidis]|uniref:MFS transporter n=1 Tax=Helicobacter sp. 15-1451 TaxID=2004995 RepID=UPI000DCBBCF0|nr:MFS transporter [Helicobacter sp. 15-1451]RAX57333.1 hypothetical protein CCZ01_06440 [Helicobacter sp. 15-1451]
MNYLAIFALATSSFVIGASEFIVVGLLSDIAISLGVSDSSAGMIVFAYAMSVVVGGPILAVLTFKMSRKATLLFFCFLFVVGNFLCAIAPTYWTLIGARIITGLAHGVFFGIASVVATSLASKEKQGFAISLVFMGLTLANVLGVPLGALIGHYYGWRMPFYIIFFCGLISLLAIFLFLPNNLRMPRGKVMREFMILKRFNVQMPLLLSIITSTSLFLLVTYVKPILLQVTQAGAESIVPIMMIFGIGLSIGSILGGRLANQRVILNIMIVMALSVLIQFGMFFVLHHLYGFGVFILLWGSFAFALCPMLQMLIVLQAKAAPNLASTFNQSAFNLGNSIGAALGAILISDKVAMPLEWLPLASGSVMILGIIGTFSLFVYVRRQYR